MSCVVGGSYAVETGQAHVIRHNKHIDSRSQLNSFVPLVFLCSADLSVTVVKTHVLFTWVSLLTSSGLPLHSVGVWWMVYGLLSHMSQ